MKCTAYEIGTLTDYKYVVTFANYNGKWILCKHKDRNTWETSGGHIEQGETPLEAARRELYEETGALAFDIEPICDYQACDEPHETKNISWANGVVFLAKVYSIGEIPESEMEKISMFDELPAKLTYPDITKIIFPYALKKIKAENKKLTTNDKERIMSIKNAAKAIIIYEGKVLLNKCLNTVGDFAWGLPNGAIYYDIPGGGQHKYEVLEETLKRECMEETGYSVTVERLAAIYEEIIVLDTEKMDENKRLAYERNSHKVFFVFVCRLDGQPQKEATEKDIDFVEAEWVEIDDVKNILLFPKTFHDNFDLILNSKAPVFLGSVRFES